jgi:hypothetical protein
LVRSRNKDGIPTTGKQLSFSTGHLVRVRERAWPAVNIFVWVNVL